MPTGYYEEWYKYVITPLLNFPDLPSTKFALLQLVVTQPGPTFQHPMEPPPRYIRRGKTPPRPFPLQDRRRINGDFTAQDKLYDDFIPDFNGKKFDAAQWIDLFATAGAKYFVLVTVSRCVS